MNIQIHPYGDWSGWTYRLKRLGFNVKKSAIAVQEEIGEKLAKMVKKNLRGEAALKYNWTPLNEKTKDFKRKHGLDSRILIATKQYLNSIEVYKYRGKVTVGIRRSERYENGATIADVAAIHEVYSTMSDKPYRPLWVPTLYEFFGTKKHTNQVLRHFVENLHAKGYPVTFRQMFV